MVPQHAATLFPDAADITERTPRSLVSKATDLYNSEVLPHFPSWGTVGVRAMASSCAAAAAVSLPAPSDALRIQRLPAKRLRIVKDRVGTTGRSMGRARAGGDGGEKGGSHGQPRY